MRVVDCVGPSFQAHCRALSEMVSAGYSPDLLVAVREGGVDVAREMVAHDLTGIEVVSVGSRRPGTAVKRRFHVEAVLVRLPRFALNGLRLVEHHARVSISTTRPARLPQVDLSDSVRLRVATSRRVLVVDDAIDSGDTLAAVMVHLATLTGAELRSAVLTVTFPRPSIQPDFAVYRGGVLLRFPWSHDAGRVR